MSEIKLDETPTLTFEPFIEEMQPPAREQKKQVTETAQAFDDSMLSDEEKKMVEDFAAKIEYCQFHTGDAVWCRCTAEGGRFFGEGTGERENKRPR